MLLRVQLHKDVLGYLFGGSPVSSDPQSNGEDHALVFAEKRGKGFYLQAEPRMPSLAYTQRATLWNANSFRPLFLRLRPWVELV